MRKNDCNCGPSRPTRQKVCCSKGVEIDYVEIPASLGTSEPDQPNAPENGAYKNAVVKYVADGAVFIYTSEGIPVRLGSGSGGGDVVSVNGKTGNVVLTTSDIENDSDYVTGTEVILDINDALSTLAQVAFTGSYNDLEDRPTIPTAVSQLANDEGYQTASQVATAVSGEASLRQAVDNNLQGQIDAISASSDVTDIVGTYAGLQAYDTSKLKDNDIIKVLQDESQNDETTYYRWSTQTDAFTLIGEEGPYYTKGQADGRFVSQTTYATDKAAVEAEIATKQNILTAGSNVNITGNVISATDTTYSAFAGTDGTTAGTAGLVPAPAITDVDKVLKGDGTWAIRYKSLDGAGAPTTATEGDYIGQLYLDTTNDEMYYLSAITPQSTTPETYEYTWNTLGGGFSPYDESRNSSDVIIPTGVDYNPNITSVYISPRPPSGTSPFVAQNRCVNILGNDNSTYSQATQIGYGANAAGPESVAIGEASAGAQAIAIGKYASTLSASGSVAIGTRASASSGSYSVALGAYAVANNRYSSVALGYLASPTRAGEVNIGTGSSTAGYNSTRYRVLGGVHPAVEEHDATTLGQLNSRILAGGTAAPTTTTAGEVGALYAYVSGTTGHLAICTEVDTTDPDNPIYTWSTLV